MLQRASRRSSLRRRPSRALGLVVALLVAGAALAQEIVISPRSIIVNPVPAFAVQVWVDKDPSGQNAPSYEVGEAIRISVRTSADAYVYLFSLAADGEVVQVLPNRFDAAGGDAFVRAGETRTFPPVGARYQFNVAPPYGLAKVMAVASRTPLDTSTLASFRAAEDFATSQLGEDQFARALRIIVTPLPLTGWVSSTALYYVGSRPSEGAYGTLSVTSEPSGASVYVDGDFVGYTPLWYGLRPGNHDVEVISQGRSYEERVNVRPDRTTEVRATFRPTVRTGSARFSSEPNGADVYVDGRYVGTTPTGALALDVGTYTAEFRRDGYETWRQVFEVRANTETRVNASLRVLTGALEIYANVGGARVFLDGREVGTVPSGSGRVLLRDLTPGAHEVTLIAQGYRTAVQTVNVQAGRTTTVTLRQSPF